MLRLYLNDNAYIAMQPIVLVDHHIPHMLNWLQTDGIEAHSIESASKTLKQKTTALIIRTEYKVTESLLHQYPNLQFLGSATAGIDHVNQELLEKKSIHFAFAKGCNASAVCHYVAKCVSHTGSQRQFNRAGIIGFGAVGKQVADFFASNNYSCLVVDPFQSTDGCNYSSVNLNDLHQIDYLCVHPNLHHQMPHSTEGLLNETLLQAQHDNTVVIQASRGLVSDETALLRHAHRLRLCIDVWHNEPGINTDLLKKSTVATPHIAGYSYQSKWRASQEITKQLYQCFSLPWSDKPLLPLNDSFTLNLGQISRQLKNDPHCFQRLRQHCKKTDETT